jgi:uncharacterized protein
VRVEGVGLDSNHGPVVVLHEMDGERMLPIWIGHNEATAIQMKLEGHEYSRPLTHDLIKNIVENLKAKLVRVDITELKDSTYYANLVMQGPAGEIRVDARPSDSIALALRFDAPIFAHESLFRVPTLNATEGEPEEPVEEPVAEESEETREERRKQELRQRLRRTDPSDFGSFKLGS